jgi:hypothetical protein
MSVETDTMPPVPQHTKPIMGKGASEGYFTKEWNQWFLQVKFKIDVINENLFSISKLSSSGIIVRDSAGNWNARTLEGTADRVTVTNGDGDAGNPTFDIAATYVGQASITTLGTITTGVWQGTVVGAGYGGTGIASYTVNNYLRASGATALEQRTPANVLDDIDAQKRFGTTSSSATAGAASALPATPSGYVEAIIGGVVKKIPYYD